jgi:anti-sigma factor RsiW
MKCQNAQRQLAEFMDKTLSPAEMKSVGQHLAACAECAEQRRKLEILRALLALKRYERPDPIYLNGMRDEFHRRLAAQRSTRRAARWVWFDTVGIQHWWERTRRIFRRHPLLALRYGIASAATVGVLMLSTLALIFVLNWRGTTMQADGDETASTSPTYMLERMPSATSGDSIPF